MREFKAPRSRVWNFAQTLELKQMIILTVIILLMLTTHYTNASTTTTTTTTTTNATNNNSTNTNTNHNNNLTWTTPEHVILNKSLPTGVCDKTLLLWEPSPYNPAAETALQPLIWCSESWYSHRYSFLEECFDIILYYILRYYTRAYQIYIHFLTDTGTNSVSERSQIRRWTM